MIGKNKETVVMTTPKGEKSVCYASQVDILEARGWILVSGTKAAKQDVLPEPKVVAPEAPVQAPIQDEAPVVEEEVTLEEVRAIVDNINQKEDNSRPATCREIVDVIERLPADSFSKSSGLPYVKDIEDILGKEISMAQRSEAWELYQQEITAGMSK